ncbi:hypothetical protein A5666_00020 [Mycolicibacterium fortuitum]|uniref:hypothetical protein n=1 Tax=Mycolicibacterium fortuitum TaxID=1766 RepID=UPI0007EB8D4A|nr:hypothetical protein [Mycolicibacterium fortuitum]OBA92964.1 hypothetical protein A5665_10660 [Mycolicibacterium fortuitum]OBI66913.1 hypothetical protein A5666_00020 [Mycolicibacterium fortuitum]
MRTTHPTDAHARVYRQVTRVVPDARSHGWEPCDERYAFNFHGRSAAVWQREDGGFDVTLGAHGGLEQHQITRRLPDAASEAIADWLRSGEVPAVIEGIEHLRAKVDAT